MPTVVNTNTISMTAARFYGAARADASQSAERISSGLRVNSALDDAAGMSMLNQLSKTNLVMEQIVQNATDGISLIHVAEGAMEEVQTMITRLRDLTIQAANETLTATDRQILKNEADQLIFEIDRIQAVTNWNGINLLDGTFTGQKIHVTPNGTQNDIDLTIANTDSETLFDDVQQFVNGDFSDTTVLSSSNDGTIDYISGWEIHKTQVDLGVTLIGGVLSPEDDLGDDVDLPRTGVDDVTGLDDQYEAPKARNGDDLTNYNYGSFQWQSSDLGILLDMDGGGVKTGFDILHGPYIISQDFIEIDGGSTVSFDWAAQGGGDAFDVYGYLLKEGTGGANSSGTVIPLLDRTGESDNDSSDGTVSIEINANDGGNYKFVFIGGTYDFTGLLGVGAHFSIGNIQVQKPGDQNTIIDYTDSSTISETLDRIDGASERLGDRRLYLGTQARRLDHVVGNALMEHEKHAATFANGYDADYAKEVAELTKNQLLMKAVSAMIAQANISPKLATMLVKK